MQAKFSTLIKRWLYYISITELGIPSPRYPEKRKSNLDAYQILSSIKTVAPLEIWTQLRKHAYAIYIITAIFTDVKNDKFQSKILIFILYLLKT